MKDVMQSINWYEVISVIWTVVILPLITYILNNIRTYTKAKKLDKYVDILYKNVVDSVKDVYETTVKDIKSTSDWTKDKQEEVKEIAKQKTLNALSTSVHQVLKAANEDFDDYLDSLIGTALYDLKNKK